MGQSMKTEGGTPERQVPEKKEEVLFSGVRTKKQARSCRRPKGLSSCVGP